MNTDHGGNIYNYSHKVCDFSANMNPLGMPKEIKQTIIENIDNYESYPDPFNRELTEEISKVYKINNNQICCGNGAADLIFRIVLGLKPKNALIVAPTFSEYSKALKTFDSSIDYYFLKEENAFVCKHDLLDAINHKYDIMFICNPNNPTGIPIPKEFILEIAKKCEKNKINLVLDECFSEFLDEEEKYSVMEEINLLPNVIILKAFTKIYAMAGIRLGFAIFGDSEKCNIVSETLQPWSVSTVAAKCGIKALQITDFREQTKKYILTNRKYLIDNLNKLGFVVYGSKANYIFFKSEIELDKKLEKYNILIRNCGNYIRLSKKYYRIAVRTKEENKYLIDCLKKILEDK